jgi:hypothetical protein
MNAFSIILADSGDDFGKIIIGIFVFIIWGIGALVKMSKTSSDKARRRQEQLDAAIRAQVEAQRQREAAAAALGQPMGRPMAMPPVLQQQQRRRQGRVPVPPPPQMRAQVQARPQQQQSRKQQKRRAVAPQQPAARVQTLLEEIPKVVESAIGQGAVPASPARRQAAAAQSMLRLTPQSIRQQFILTEILQPPLALRDQLIP